ncbi:response regulator [Blautia massiliensis (ex Durand et al. 2017)]|uniref:response regulator n=1 Tax=Blautia massiliensis (ex Durand et al. 2017) TaxID=1737424 RepID=UPI002ED31B19
MRANSDLLEADNAEDGLKIILKEHPDIIITDMKMPVMDGTQLLKNLEELHIDSKISVISGFSDFKYTRLAIQAGVIDYILKPALRSPVR